METRPDAPTGLSPSERDAVARHYDAALPSIVALFGPIPVLWATAEAGLDAPPVYHAALADDERGPDDVAFATTTGAARYAPRLTLEGGARLVRDRGAVALLSWTPLPEDPDRAAFGRIHLTPHGAAGLDRLAEAARSVRAALRARGLDAIPVTDGPAALMLWIPLAGGPPCARVGAALRALCAELAARDPERLTVAWRRAERGDRVYLSAHSDAAGALAGLPYALDVAPGLPVRRPRRWEALDLAAPTLTAATFAATLRADGPVFAEALAALRAQTLPDDLVPATGRPARPGSASTALAPAEGAAADDASAEGAAPTPPHAYLTTAAIAVLGDGRARTVEEILADAVAARLLPADLPRRYLYTALHEYVVRARGTGACPEFVQVDATRFRLNRPADPWPAAALPPAPTWSDAATRDALAATLRATAVGEDPAAFERAVCAALAGLGFAVRHVGGRGAPDGIATAPLGREGYAVVVECKTARAGAPVANPRPEEPAGFRDRLGARYALLVGPLFGDERSFEDELLAHGTALWTVEDLSLALAASIGPDEIAPALAPGRAARALELILWERDHGRRKRVAATADRIAACGWRAQVACEGVAPADRPRLTREALLLLVDQALLAEGVGGGVAEAEFDDALRLALDRGTVRLAREAAGAEPGYVARAPDAPGAATEAAPGDDGAGDVVDEA